MSPESVRRMESPFSEEEVRVIICQLGNNKAEGVDRIPPEALKNCIPKFVALVTKLFNLVKVERKAPECWKTGRMVLLHKSGSDVTLANYRLLNIIVAMSGLFQRF